MFVSKKRFMITVINLLILIVLSINMIIRWDQYPGEDWCTTVSIISLVLIAYQIIVLKIVKYRYTDFVPWFVVLSYMFLYGRIIVKAMGHDDEIAWTLFAHFNDIDIYKSGLFCLMYTQAIFTGMMLLKVNKELQYETSLTEKRNRENSIYTPNCLKFIGWGVFIVTMPIKLYCNVLTIIAQQVSGGYAISGNFNGVLLALSYTPTVGMILIMCSEKYSARTMRIIFFTYMAYECLYMIFSGDRRQEVIGAIALILCYCKLKNIKLSIKKIFFVVVVAFIGLTFLAAIRTGRRSVISSFSTFVDLYKTVSQNNLFIETFGEFGATFFTVVNGVTYYPSKFGFTYGLTYLAGIAIIVPGIMTSLFPNLFLYGSVAGRCYSLNNLALGGSLAQDMYCNFGFGAIFSSVIMGYILAKTLRAVNLEQSSQYRIAKYYILFYIMLNGVRCGFYELTRPIAYAFLLIWIFKMLFYLKKEKQ